MPRRREDMTDEEYQAMLKRLSAMREKSAALCAAKKAARSSAAAPEQVAPAAPAAPEPSAPEQVERSADGMLRESISVPEPDTFDDTPPLALQEPPTPVKLPRQRKTKPIAILTPPKPQMMDETELDKYFQAKYKWKTAYATPKEVVEPVRVTPQPSMAAAVRNTAQDQIRTRVNDEVLKMAMKSVFPDWRS